MRHGKKVMHLGRKTAHRKSMLANMACSLIEHKRINTTVTKAKALKQFIEPIITKSKSDTTHNRRLAFSSLRDKEAVSELFREIAAKVGDRPGGYTRIIKLGNRLGDNADMAMIELVDFNEVYKTEEKAKKKLRRRGGKTKSETPAAEASAAAVEDQKKAAPEADEKTKAVTDASTPEKETEAPKSDEKKSKKKDGE
ncbi:50S ribosomal protein L17 [Flavobacteriaceae bacterium]|nr:50S ribosomal protein L17 [Flavobacteriaceae bacterium]MDA9015662.1 50S ribosomal protein L17 [Flavobacteriaceae bacterium]MDA9571749.1 50S ribosomal protein L17 [Flavobacteriaceae bacterium]MDB3862681.1 50S ribosomal protein L17 [Flavobacteriaceae bacterium]MDC3354551.1 50S ribosomal protein L17 [Flavobacteriaceae bacterium]